MANDTIERHCAQIERCNQRGGRMLSIVDLIEAGTFTRELAAYALAAISQGASFMVGALPGGAGKTTVMGALLNFVPRDVELLPAVGMASIQEGMSDTAPRRCYICHEIGPGAYYAYLWNRELRAYFELAGAGHMLATNLHADTYAQAQAQICGGNRVPEASFRRMNLMFFILLDQDARGLVRRIDTVWESDGENPHRLVYSAGLLWGGIESRLVSGAELDIASQTIEQMIKGNVRTIEEVRSRVTAARSESC
jgi:hypothetical protein